MFKKKKNKVKIKKIYKRKMISKKIMKKFLNNNRVTNDIYLYLYRYI